MQDIRQQEAIHFADAAALYKFHHVEYYVHVLSLFIVRDDAHSTGMT